MGESRELLGCRIARGGGGFLGGGFGVFLGCGGGEGGGSGEVGRPGEGSRAGGGAAVRSAAGALGGVSAPAVPTRGVTSAAAVFHRRVDPEVLKAFELAQTFLKLGIDLQSFGF